MKSLKRLLSTVILWLLIGGLLVININWGEEFIIYSVAGDAVCAIQPNDKDPEKLIEATPVYPDSLSLLKENSPQPGGL